MAIMLNLTKGPIVTVVHFDTSSNPFLSPSLAYLPNNNLVVAKL